MTRLTGEGSNQEKEPGDRPAARGSRRSVILTFVIMFGLWCLLSGKFDAFHLTLGVISSAMVAFFSGDLLFSPSAPGRRPVFVLRFFAYVPWLLCQIFLSALHLMYLVFHPRMQELIDPHIVRFRSKLKSELALITFANSITLTPGTITVYVNPFRDFKVHAIDRVTGDPLPGEMEERIARTFGES